MSILRHWFAQPWALRLLVLLPILAVIGMLAWQRRRRALARWGSQSAVQALISVRRQRRWLRLLGRGASVCLLILGIAGPRWGRDEDPATTPGREIVVLLDLSRSMLAQDVLGQASPNRLGRAKDAVLDLVNAVQHRGGHRLGLVVFAARAQIVCPLTHDYDHFRDALTDLNPTDPLLDIGPGPEGAPSGTRIGAGLRQAVQTHDPRNRGYQDILLISDGDDPARDGEWNGGIEAARALDIPVHTVGIGDPERGSPIPGEDDQPFLYQGKRVLTRLVEKPLEEIARSTGGTYTPARTNVIPMGEIFRQRIESRAGRQEIEDIVPVYRQHPEWFFAGALLFMTMDLVLADHRPHRSRKRVSNEEAE
jgi:Ca-activated chloride channel family protein